MRKGIALLVALLLMFVSTSVVFAASNPSVTTVNPISASTLYSDNLLISVKLTEPMTVKASVSQVYKVVNGTNAAITAEEYAEYLKAKAAGTEPKTEVAKVSYVSLDSFTSTNNLSFYTKKLENVKPGIYDVNINTLGADGKAIYNNWSYVIIKAKEENPADPAVFENNQSGTAQILKNLLQNIFGN